MELFDLQNSIKKNEIPHLLIFLGDEYKIMELYLNMISKTLNIPTTSIDEASSVISRSKIISFIVFISSLKYLHIILQRFFNLSVLSSL